jgi:NAD(P)-dependent dehydrogenase (short-subunit alcohol dehydrogenase family)
VVAGRLSGYAVRPGTILTPRLTGIPEPQREPLFKALTARTLVKKMGEPEEGAEAVLFLMGNGSSPDR